MKTATINGIQYTKEQFQVFARLGSYAKVGDLLKCGRARARKAMTDLGVFIKKEKTKCVEK